MKTGSKGQETQRLLHLPARRHQEEPSLEVTLIGRDQCRHRKSAARVAADRLRLQSRNVLPLLEDHSLRYLHIYHISNQLERH